MNKPDLSPGVPEQPSRPDGAELPGPAGLPSALEVASPPVPRPAPAPEVAVRHLQVLRTLLHRDYLARASWSLAVQDLARMVREALGATEALVAFFHASTGRWSAINAAGIQLNEEQISAHASRSVLDRVRTTGAPILSTGDIPLTLSSTSIQGHRLESVLAVPLFELDVNAPAAEQRFDGCLYVHRTIVQPPFTDQDVALVLDITSIAQVQLNLLRYLQDLETVLDASRAELEELRETVHREYRLGRYETQDAAFAENVLLPLRRIASADKVGLLILGPTGSGKSFLAQAYHYECVRKSGPFVVLDCAQVTSGETLTAELFGYAARSGYANSPPTGRPGKAQLAHKGTLFIDEIACLPLELQQRLLRLIQTGRYSPLGSSEERQVDIQIITATNEDLPRLVQERRFREDLYWRLAEIVVELPSLERRAADVPRLAQRFVELARARYGRIELAGVTPEALHRLQQHPWGRAGNLRGLEHAVNRSVLMAPPGTRQLTPAHLKLDVVSEARDVKAAPLIASMPQPAKPEREGARKRGRPAAAGPAIDEIVRAIREHGSATEAALALEMTRDALVWRLRKAGLTVSLVLEAET